VVEQEDGDILLSLLQEKAAHGEAFTKADRIALTMSSLLEYSRPLDEVLPEVARTAWALPEGQRASIIGAMVGLASYFVDVRVLMSIIREVDLPNLPRHRVEQCFARSVAEGQERGKRETMRSILRARFGSLSQAVEQRIANADTAELDALIARVGVMTGIEEFCRMDLTGTWVVVSSLDFDDDYMGMDGTSYVRLQQEGGSLSGEYHIGLQNGGIDGRIEDGQRAIQLRGHGRDGRRQRGRDYHAARRRPPDVYTDVPYGR